MKKLLPLLTLIGFMASCDKETTSTEPTETKKRVVYKLMNESSATIEFKYYASVAAYNADTGVVYMGTLAAGETKEFDLSSFSRLGDYSTYYLDWYNSADMSNSSVLGTDAAKETMYEYPNSGDSATVVTKTIGISDIRIYKNDARKTLFGTSVNPIWYDITTPNDGIYILNRSGSFTYKKSGKDYNGFINSTTEGHAVTAKPYTRCTFQVSSTGNPPSGSTITLYNGEGFTPALGSATMVESKGGTELRTFKRR